jgi:hypothetical protein
MSKLKSHLNIALQSIKCFTDDGKLDEVEINFIMGLALADNVLDEDEKRVLSNIFRRAGQSNCSALTAARIIEIKKKYSID